MEGGYRRLETGEIIQAGDEIYYGDPGVDEWEPVTEAGAGGVAPDPQFISHRVYRRKIEELPK